MESGPVLHVSPYRFARSGSVLLIVSKIIELFSTVFFSSLSLVYTERISNLSWKEWNWFEMEKVELVNC